MRATILVNVLICCVQSALVIAMKNDLYKLLGVKSDASPREIKRAFRKMALQYHPDKNQATDATEKFFELSEAFDVLTNPELRRKYDSGDYSSKTQEQRTYQGDNFKFTPNDFFSKHFEKHMEQQLNNPHLTPSMKDSLKEHLLRHYESLKMAQQEVKKASIHFGHPPNEENAATANDPNRKCETITTKVGDTVTKTTSCKS